MYRSKTQIWHDINVGYYSYTIINGKQVFFKYAFVQIFILC